MIKKVLSDFLVENLAMAERDAAIGEYRTIDVVYARGHGAFAACQELAWVLTGSAELDNGLGEIYDAFGARLYQLYRAALRGKGGESV